MISEETRFQTRYFSVITDKSGNVTSVNTERIAAVSREDAQALAASVLESGKTTGLKEIYRFLVSDRPDGGRMVIFLDCNREMQSAGKLLIASSGIAGFSLVAMFILVYVFSLRAIRPVAQAFEKQKQFITDAGHEFKTPLAVISANTDVIEITSGKSEWLESIRNQTKRMNNLVRDLLTLSRLDEEKMKMTMELFDLSDAVWDTAAPFEVMAKSQNKSFTLDIQGDITYTGNEQSLRRLVSILTDNAVKYTPDGGEIKITLEKNERCIILKTDNTCDSIDKNMLARLFDRFYRGDESRSRETGGYGIGLSIAKETAEAHKGRIAAKSERESTITFLVTLPD